MSLKACPFCGNYGYKVSYYDHDKRQKFYISCYECSASSTSFETEELAAMAWNRRIHLPRKETRKISQDFRRGIVKT